MHRLVELLAARGPELPLAFALKIERYSSADKILQGLFIHVVAFMDVDSAPGIPVEAGVEKAARVLQRSSFRKRQFDYVFVRLSGAHDTAVGPDGSPPPLPLFDHVWVCVMYNLADFGERLPAPIPKFLDLSVNQCRSRFHWEVPFLNSFGFIYISSASDPSILRGVSLDLILHRCPEQIAEPDAVRLDPGLISAPTPSYEPRARSIILAGPQPIRPQGRHA